MNGKWQGAFAPRALVAVSVAAALLVGGCTVSAKSDAQGTIRVVAQAGGPGDALKAAAEAYTAAGKGKVEVDLYDYDAVRERTVLGFTSGQSTYDVIGFDYLWMPQYIKDGYLSGLTNMIAAKTDMKADDFVPAYTTWATVDGTQYAVPWFGAVYMLYYRTDLLEKAGVAVPTTWDEYLAAAKAVEASTGVTGTTLIGKRDDPLMCEYWSLAWSNGAALLDSTGKKSAVNSPAAVKTLDQWKQILKFAPKDALAADWPAAAASFSEGKAAMMINFSDTSDALIADTSAVKGKVGFAALPAGATGKSTPNLGGWGLGVSAKSTNQQGAFDFIAWATSAEQQNAALAKGGSPSRVSVLSDPANQKSHPYFEAALANYKNAIYFPVTSSWVDWEAAIAPALSEGMSGKVSVDQAVANASQRLDAELAKG